MRGASQWRNSTRAACAAAGVLLAGNVHAELWELKPTASLSGEYSDNPRLLLDDAQEAYGWLGNFDLDVARATERTVINLQTSLHYAHYTDEDDYDRNDRSMVLGLRHDAERTQWTANMQFARNNTLTTEAETTGLVRANKIRETATAALGANHQYSESLVLGSQLAATSNHYRDAEFTGLSDYDYTRASVFTEWRASDRNRWAIEARASELRSEIDRPDTQDYAVMLRWTFQPMDLWTAGVSVGPSLAESGTERQEGALYALDVSKRTEKGGWTLSGSRERTPTGFGELVATDRLSISGSRAISEQLNVSLQGLLGRNRDLFTEHTRPTDLKFARLEAKLAWKLSQQLRFDLMVAGVEQDGRQDSKATNFSVAVGFSWNGKPLYL